MSALTVQEARRRIEWTVPFPEPRTPMQRDSHDEALRNLDAFEKAVRAEAIAETEAKFRALAEKWRKDMKCHGGNPAGWADKYATSLESILAPCPQSRHDAGEGKPC